MLLGRTTLASRVFDVLRAVRFLTELERAADGVALRGYGTAALWGYLAAALEQRIHTVHVSGMLPSWQEVVDTRLYDGRAITSAVAVPGVLQELDLPDLHRCFAGRELIVEAPLRVPAGAGSLPLRP